MKKRTPISAIMTTDVITLNLTDNLEIAESLFKKKQNPSYSSCKR